MEADNCFIKKYNLAPTELWLGPCQLRELQEWGSEQSKLPLTIRDGNIFCGKKICLMKKDGLKVGISLSVTTDETVDNIRETMTKYAAL